MVVGFRRLEIGDLDFLMEVRNSYAEDFLHDSRTFTLAQTCEWFIKTSPDYWTIVLGERLVGYFRLSNYSETNRNVYVGADVHPDFQGKGIATEAYRKFLPFLFQEYDLNKISLEVLASNEKAIHLYEKLGFVHEGKKRQEVLKGNAFVDSIVMSMLRSEINF
jgi:RimJ/RimL family protein N-acetyltransferase